MTLTSSTEGCCGDDSWRGRLCDYHQGYKDGLDEWEAERQALLSEVREWFCLNCRTVYPGPPQKSVWCVVCPSCGGKTLPHSVARRLELEQENERLSLNSRNWSTAVEDLIDILGDDHDEEECDNFADVIEEIRVVVSRYRQALSEIGKRAAKTLSGES